MVLAQKLASPTEEDKCALKSLMQNIQETKGDWLYLKLNEFPTDFHSCVNAESASDVATRRIILCTVTRIGEFLVHGGLDFEDPA
eukprot:6392117-Heterocapsa_arctica.AAC.1